ncbi:tape measure protein [Sporomusa sphaeroides DSM 2875]|uniref:tape measure protein n=1 Tax=Sporomusa sphaeroides TaxID=47679 RepID=UPI00202F2732|nr:tape measure protein [Sporomusa sphaeroides]MCM0760663.1 tape measure protein [Sporomusa sphaeroides DSM 2875]
MADTQFTGLVVKIKGDLGDYSGKLNKMDADTQRTSQRVISALNNIGAVSVFKGGLGIAGALAGIQGVSATLSSAVETGIQFNSTLEQSEIAFGSMLKSADAGKALLRDLMQMAEKTPFEFADLQTGAKRLLAFGFAAKDILPMLTAIGDATSALGMSGAEGINRLGLALGQMRAKGKVAGGEMMQLTEAGIPAWEILAKAIGKTTAEVMEMSEKGLIPAEQAIQYLIAGMNERFGGMMEKQSQTFQGQMSNLGDVVSSTMGLVVKPAFDVLSNSTLPAVTEQVSLLRDVLQAGGYEGLAKSILPVEVVDDIKIGMDALTLSAKYAYENLELVGSTVAVGSAIYFAPRVIGGITIALEALQGAAMLAAGGMMGVTYASAAILANPLTWPLLAATAAFGGLTYAALEFGKTIPPVMDDATDGTKRFLDGSTIMADGSIVAFTHAADSASDLADSIENSGNRSYAAAMTLWEAMKLAREVEKSDMDYATRVRKNADTASVTTTTLPTVTGTGKKGKAQTEFEKYRAETQDMLSVWSQQVALEKISKEQFAAYVQERLNGLAKINVQEKEKTDKLRLEYELTGKIAEIGRQQQQEAIETGQQKYRLGQITIKQYIEIIERQKELAKTEKERLDLAVRIAVENAKIIAQQIKDIERRAEKERQLLSIEQENSRHKLAMQKIITTERKSWAEEEYKMALENLNKEIQEEKLTLKDKLSIYEEAGQKRKNLTSNEQDQYKALIEEQKNLDAKYRENKLRLDHEYAEKAAAYQQAIIDANNDMIASLISGTKSGHDVLKNMWSDFVRMVVEKNLSIKSSLNIFENLLGPMFGLKSNTGSSSNFSWDLGPNSILSLPIAGARAGGGDVEAGKAYLTSELGPEIFIPKTPGTIIPNNQLKNLTNNNPAPKVSVTVINNTGVEADTKASQPEFDGENWVCNVVLDKAARSPVYAKNLKTALGV